GVRPFGVSLLVAGYDDNGPQLYQVDPSGSYFSWKASAMGKNVSNAKTFLEKRYLPLILVFIVFRTKSTEVSSHMLYSTSDGTDGVGLSFTLHFIAVETLQMQSIIVLFCRYTDDMELDDAVHTAILTLKEGFEGQISGKNIEIGIIGTDRKFRQAPALTLSPFSLKLYGGAMLMRKMTFWL
ncbi:hypothetical protein Gohar_026105, partial [Gossypium harknessii]|nr:hypothetical protein [Gossypium harknessii]